MNAFKSLIATVALAAAAVATTAAQASVINFNGLANGNIVYNNSTAVSTGGMSFKGSSATYFVTSTYNGGDNSNFSYNGSDFLLSYSAFTLASAAAAPFSVNSFDLASWYDSTPISTVTLTGTFVGGGSISKVLTLTGSNLSKQTGNDFTMFNLTGFNNLSSLTFNGNNAYLALDNLVVNAAAATTVPEPSSIALFGLALAAGALVRRRRA
jgi:hypothetical protein